MLVSLNSGLGMGRSDTDSEEVVESVIFIYLFIYCLKELLHCLLRERDEAYEFSIIFLGSAFQKFKRRLEFFFKICIIISSEDSLTFPRCIQTFWGSAVL